MKTTISTTLQTQPVLNTVSVNSAFTNVDLWNIHNMVRGRGSRRYI